MRTVSSYADWQAACDAVVTLTWMEQVGLALPLKVDLVAMLKERPPAERARIVADFRREHLEVEGAQPTTGNGSRG